MVSADQSTAAKSIDTARNGAAEADANEPLSEAAEREHSSQQLREYGPAFLSDLLDELRRQAAAFTAKVKDHRFRIFAANGPHGSGETMLAFGEHIGTFFRVPAIIVRISERGDQLVQGTYTSQVIFKADREEVLSWHVRDGQIEILKKGEPQTLESFASELIENLLKRFAK